MKKNDIQTIEIIEDLFSNPTEMKRYEFMMNGKKYSLMAESIIAMIVFQFYQKIQNELQNEINNELQNETIQQIIFEVEHTNWNVLNRIQRGIEMIKMIEMKNVIVIPMNSNFCEIDLEEQRMMNELVGIKESGEEKKIKTL